MTQTSAMRSKWQGTVEIGYTVSYIDESEHHLKWVEFRDMDGDPLFDILPHQDSGEGVCREVGQYFVLNVLGWDEYDEICRRMKGTTIRVDLSGLDLG